MFNRKTKNHTRSRILLRAAVAAGVSIVAFVGSGTAQTDVQTVSNTAVVSKDPNVIVSKAAAQPVLTNYKDVKIGSSAAEVREKLGKAKIDDEDGFYYRFNNDEFAQIRLDKNKSVRLLSVTYSGDKNIPAYADVVGSDDQTDATRLDGSVYKVVSYPEAGYWVAYSRTAGNDPSVTVTMQKIE